MTAAEFGHWIAFWAEEPTSPAALLGHVARLLAAAANGALKPPSGRMWQPADFQRALWVEEAEAQTDAASIRAGITGLMRIH